MSFRLQRRGKVAFQLIPGVVRGNRDAHAGRISTAEPLADCYLSPPAIIRPMRNTAKWLTLAAFMLASIGGAAAPRHAASDAATRHSRPRSSRPSAFSVDLVTTDVIARDGQGQFVSDLKTGRIRSLRRRRQAGHRLARADTRRPRVQRAGAATGAGPGRASSCRAARPTNDAAGRVFLIFIDDLHSTSA